MPDPSPNFRTRTAHLVAVAAMLMTVCTPLRRAEAQQNAPSAPADPERRTAYEWRFRDADVATLTQRLRSVGILIPVNLEGTISSELIVEVPWTSLRDARAWRIGGMLTSEELTIDGLTLKDLAVFIDYRNGNLYLNRLRFRVPDERAVDPPATGRVSGVATMELVPRGRFTATLNVEDLPMAVISAVVENAPPTTGLLTGSLSAQADVDRLQDLTGWTIEGPVTLSQFTFNESPPVEAGVQLKLSEGRVTARDFRLEVEDSELTGQGTLSLLGKRSWNARATVSARSLGPLEQLLSRFLDVTDLQPVAEVVDGALNGTAKLSGTLSPSTRSGSGQLLFTDLHVQRPRWLAEQLPLKPLTVERLALAYELQRDLVTLSNIDVTVADGRVKGEGGVTLEEARLYAGLSLSEMRPKRILGEPFDSEGTLNGRVKLIVPLDGEMDPSKWTLASNLAISELRYADSRLANLRTGDIELRQGWLTIPRLTADLDGQPVALTLSLGVQPPYPIEAEYDLTRVSLQNLNTLPQLSELPFTLGGELGVTGNLSGTLRPMAVTAVGRAVGTPISVNGRQIDELQTDYGLSGASLALTGLSASLYGGRASGKAKLSFGQQPGGSTQLEWTGIDAGAVAAGLIDQLVAAGGRSDGSLSLSIPPGSLKRPEHWQGTATIALEQLQVHDWELQDIAPIEIVLRDGELGIQRFEALLDGEPVLAVLTVGVQAPWPVDARFDLQKLQLDRLGSLPQLSMLKDRVSGRITLTGQARGQLAPLALSGGGTAEIEPFTYDRYTVDRLRLDYELADQLLQISGIDAAAWNGDVTGTAEIPLTLETGGGADLQFQTIDIARLLGEAVEKPLDVRGILNGHLQVTAPAGHLQQPEQWDITAAAEISRLMLQNMEFASVEAEARQQNGRLAYEASGRVLDGSLQVAGNRTGTWMTAAGLIDPGTGNLTLRGANLSQAARIWAPDLSQQLRGSLDLTGSWNGTSDGLAWNADAGVPELSVDGRVIAQGLSLRLQGLDQTVRIEEITGSLAGGRLTASADADLSRTRPTDFSLNLRRAVIERLMPLEPLFPDIPLEGFVDLNLVGEAGRTWRMRGSATSVNGRFAAFPFLNARLPFSLDWHPESGHLRLQSASGHVSLPSGRVTGTLRIRRAGGLTVDGNYRFHDVGLQSILQQLGGRSRISRGRASGSLTISGRNVRSIDDLQVRVAADLRDAQPMNMPVLSQIRSFVPGAAASGATRFQEGRIEAMLRGDVIEISRLSLASSQLQIYLTGRVNRNGRLNLDAVVSSGQGTDPVLAQLLLKQLIAVSAPPVGALLLANDYLANRVVHLTIRGTIRQPAIQVRPFESLGEEALRFFLRQSIGVSG